MDLTGGTEQPRASKIQKFYSGCNVFVTGATGFMGKVLVEKLLRSTDVATIYILVRAKKGKSIHVRMEEIIDDIVFDRLRAEKKFKHRLVAIAGDCSLPGLGLNAEEKQLLISQVHIVFHCAATVRFDENLKTAFRINVSATKDILNLAQQMENLKSIVHVSTAYANCHLNKIEERFYDYAVSYDDVEKMLEKMDNERAQEITPRILNEWPNTYTFTKAMAEGLVRDNCTGLPLGIFRPAIVVSTYNEPFPGWIDNMYGPTGVIAGAVSGFLRTLLCDFNVTANIVPVDTCAAALIASAWDVSIKNVKRSKHDVPVYNYVSSVENPITWGEFMTINVMHDREYPFSKSVWCVCFQMTTNPLINNLQKLFYHYVPAVIADLVSFCIGQKPRFLSMYKKVHKFSDVIQHFCTHEWEFTNTNVVKLWQELDETDRQIFPFSIKTVLWIQFFKTYIKGLREHLLKDPLETLPAAQARERRFTMVHMVLKWILCFVIMYTLWGCITKIFTSEKSLTFQHV